MFCGNRYALDIGEANYAFSLSILLFATRNHPRFANSLPAIDSFILLLGFNFWSILFNYSQLMDCELYQIIQRKPSGINAFFLMLSRFVGMSSLCLSSAP